jgi:CDP-diacylglycerol--glycerol-3-phosphate 3-phosphatidyltransferase
MTEFAESPSRPPKKKRERKPRRPLAPRRSIRDDAFNLPNVLTMLRIVAIPLVLWLLYDGRPFMNVWAALSYGAAAATDGLDGWLARKRGLVSVLGQFLDPLADKLLVMALLVVMVDMGRVPAWAVAVVLARELSITSLRTIAISEGVVIAASQGGKEKTALQMVALLLLMLHHRYLLNFGFFQTYVDMHEAGLFLLYVSVAFAVTSAGEYVKLFVDAVEAKEKRLKERDEKRAQERESHDAGL